MKIYHLGLFPGWQIYFPTLHTFTSAAFGKSSDTAIWDFAASEGFTIAPKDWDLHDQGVLQTGRPKAIWLRIGNCSTDQLAKLLLISGSKL